MLNTVEHEQAQILKKEYYMLYHLLIDLIFNPVCSVEDIQPAKTKHRIHSASVHSYLPKAILFKVNWESVLGVTNENTDAYQEIDGVFWFDLAAL